MIKINLICVGDIKEEYLKDAISEYTKRISRFANLNIIEIKENVATSSSEKDILQALEKDATNIIKHIKGYTICLDLNARQMDSVEFSKYIDSLTLTNSEITFIIGASNGIADRIKKLSNDKISFSKMTFPHQLMRVIFLEQLYRGFTISKNIAYHK